MDLTKMFGIKDLIGGMQLRAACGCHQGKKRNNNEDNLYFDGSYMNSDNHGLPSIEKTVLSLDDDGFFLCLTVWVEETTVKSPPIQLQRQQKSFLRQEQISIRAILHRHLRKCVRLSIRQSMKPVKSLARPGWDLLWLVCIFMKDRRGCATWETAAAISFGMEG